jgi:hypothetical protein
VRSPFSDNTAQYISFFYTWCYGRVDAVVVSLPENSIQFHSLVTDIAGNNYRCITGIIFLLLFSLLFPHCTVLSAGRYRNPRIDKTLPKFYYPIAVSNNWIMTGHFGREVTADELRAIQNKPKLIKKRNTSHNSTSFWSIFENVLGSLSAYSRNWDINEGSECHNSRTNIQKAKPNDNQPMKPYQTTYPFYSKCTDENFVSGAYETTIREQQI